MACHLDGVKPLSGPNAGMLLIWHLGANFAEIIIKIHTFSLMKMPLRMLSTKWWPFCLSLNVLMNCHGRHHEFYIRHIEILVFNNQWSKFWVILTHCGLVMPHGDIDLGQHWFRWFPDRTKPLPKPMLTYPLLEWTRYIKKVHQKANKK